MENMGVGGGMVIASFWMFVSLAVLGGVWENIRKRESQHETVRRIIESGQQIDQQTIDKLLSISDGSRTRLDKGFRVTALWILPVSFGMAALAFFIGLRNADALMPVLGVAALLFCLGVGFLIAARVAERWYPNEDGANTTPFQD